MLRFALLSVLFLVGLGVGLWIRDGGSEPAGWSIDEALAALSIDGFVEHMSTLSDDDLAGRRPGTEGYDSAAAYVAREARELGLEPGGVDGTYMQPIRFRRSSVTTGSEGLSVDGEALRPGVDFVVSPEAGAEEIDITAPLVFAGFGIHGPDQGWDDLAGIDVSGRIVVLVSGTPDRLGSLERTVLGSTRDREAQLRARGARAAIRISSAQLDGPSWDDAVARLRRPRVGYLPPPNATDGGESAGLPSVTVSRSVAEAWFAAQGRDLDAVEASLRGGEPQSFDLGLEARITARFEHESFESANVVAVLPGSDPGLAEEYLVMTAHLDHLGVGTAVDGDSIYNGTLDNASGSAALLTLASVLTRMDRPRRSLAFLWLTAEEVGLLGSDYFARYPSIAPGRVVANQNIDGVMAMITASSDVLAFGYEHSNLSEAVDVAVARTGTPVSPDPTPEENLFVRSDQYSFVRQGIPAIWVQGGRTGARPGEDPQAALDEWIRERYHQPDDDLAQPLDLEGVEVELRANLMVTHHILNEMGPIRWNEDSFLYRRFATEGVR